MTLSRIGIAAILAAAVAIIANGGCATLGTAPESSNVATAATPTEAVQRAINEANIDITAAARVLNQYQADKVFTPKQAAEKRERLRELAKTIDEAQQWLRDGLVAPAADQVGIGRQLIIGARKEIERQGAKANQTTEKPR